MLALKISTPLELFSTPSELRAPTIGHPALFTSYPRRWRIIEQVLGQHEVILLYHVASQSHH